MAKYNVGDVLQIRQWDDMVEEFGLDINGNIETPSSFTTGMKYLCGKKFTVAHVLPFDDGAYIAEEDIFQAWSIDEGMLEPYLQELDTVSDLDFQTMLS